MRDRDSDMAGCGAFLVLVAISLLILVVPAALGAIFGGLGWCLFGLCLGIIVGIGGWGLLFAWAGGS